VSVTVDKSTALGKQPALIACNKIFQKGNKKYLQPSMTRGAALRFSVRDTCNRCL